MTDRFSPVEPASMPLSLAWACSSRSVKAFKVSAAEVVDAVDVVASSWVVWLAQGLSEISMASQSLSRSSCFGEAADANSWSIVRRSSVLSEESFASGKAGAASVG